MIFLMAAVLTSTILVLTFKLAHVKGWNGDNITAVNYGLATVLIFCICLGQGLLPAFGQVARVNLSALFSEQSVSGTMVLVLAAGLITGILYVVNISLVNVNVCNNGAGISTLFSRSGFLISLGVSFFLFGDRMTWMRWVGAFLTVFALAVVSGIGSGRFRLVRPLLLLGSLVCVGLIDTNNKIYSSFALPEYKTNLMLVAFVVSSIIYAVYYRRKYGKRQGWPKLRWQEVLAGIAMGLPNAFSNMLQILALERVPATVAFPTLAAGNLLLSTVLGVVLFKEKLSVRSAMAILLTAVSLVLVNLPA